MLQELKFQLSTAILTVLTIAAAMAAALNYQQIHRFRLPDDGVTWGDQRRWTARREQPQVRSCAAGGAERPGGTRRHPRQRHSEIHSGSAPIADTSDVPRRLAYVGAWAKAAYVVSRRAPSVDVDVAATVYCGRSCARHRHLLAICGGRGLSRHRPVRLLPPRQRIQSPPFLYLLSGFLHLFRASITPASSTPSTR